MVRNPDILRRFEDAERRRSAGFTIEESFRRLDEARQEARSLRPDLWVFPTKTKLLLDDHRVQRLRRLRAFFSRVRSPS